MISAESEAYMLKVTVKNPSTKQFQLEYAMYMMLGSFFRKATCRSHVLENRLMLYYAELGSEKQYELEDTVLKTLEKKILPEILPLINKNEIEELETLDCTISIANKGNHHQLSFETAEGYSFSLNVAFKSKRSFEYMLVKQEVIEAPTKSTKKAGVA